MQVRLGFPEGKRARLQLHVKISTCLCVEGANRIVSFPIVYGCSHRDCLCTWITMTTLELIHT